MDGILLRRSEFSLIQSKIPFGVIFLPIVYYAESRQIEHFEEFVDH